jgi:hypothetical protein
MFFSQVIPELIFLFFLFFGLKKKQDEKYVLILQRTETKIRQWISDNVSTGISSLFINHLK